jgi:polar amino acid transport system substrate-binding protein
MQMKMSFVHRLVLATSPLLSCIAFTPAMADALDDITKSGTLRVGVFPDFPPFSSVDASMALQGYDIDVAQLLADKLNVKLDLVTITGQNRIPYLNDHRVDLLLSVGYTAERAKVIDYTKAYAPYYVAAIGPKALKVESTDDLADKTIAVNRGTYEDDIATKVAPTARLLRFDNYNGVIQAFLSGQAQLMIVGNDVGSKILAEQTDLQPEMKLKLLSSPDHIGINKGEDRLKGTIDAFIDEIVANGKLNDIAVKWLKRPIDPKDLVD